MEAKPKRPNLGRKTPFWINSVDLAVLIANFYRAANHPEIGYNDSDVTIEQMSRRLRTIGFEITMREMESLLYCSNMLDEVDEFWHINDFSFEYFSKTLLSSATDRKVEFNREYNLIQEKK